jgi:general secretion pathway protein D
VLPTSSKTTILSGLLDKEETKSITGIPGLAQIPGVSPFFSGHNNSLTDSELLILITPRVLRTPDRLSRTIYAGRGEPSGRGSLGSAPLPAAAPPGEREEPRPTGQPNETPQLQEPAPPGAPGNPPAQAPPQVPQPVPPAAKPPEP